MRDKSVVVMRIPELRSRVANADYTVATSYNGLGGVIGLATTGSGGSQTEAFTLDAIGNRIASWRQDDDPNAADPGTARVFGYNAGGALNYVAAANNDSTAGHYLLESKNYDGAGNEVSTGTASRHDLNSSVLFEQRVSYYDAAQRLREMERHLGGYSQSSADTPDDYGSYEEYRYDALGRRVFVVSLGNGGRFAEQTVWDGEQMLSQQRDQYPNTTSGTGAYTGTVRYVNAPEALGLDRPVAVWARSGTITPHADWRGAYAYGTTETGATDCCAGFVWPATAMTVDHLTPHQSGMVTWLGGLLQEGGDKSALQYKRNRYYDPTTGRFTQVDPIGLAGGVNAYGFAGGDPVNYSDPFGLMSCPPECGDALIGVGRLLQPAQGPLEVAGTLVTAPLAGGMGMAAGLSGESVALGATLRSGAGGGILTAAGVAQRVAGEVGGTVSELSKSGGFKVTVQAGKNIVARIKSSGEMRVGIDRVGSLTQEGMVSADRALTHLRNLSSQEIIDLVNKAKQLVGAPR